MAKIFASVGKAFSFAGNNTFKRPGIWLLVTLTAFLEVLFLPIMALSIIGLIPGGAELVKLILAPVLQGFFGHIYDIILALFNLGSIGLMCVLIISAILFILFGLFLCGLVIRILGGKDITFAGFFGTVGRGFQFLVIGFIYNLVIEIVFILLGFIFGMSILHASPEANLPLFIIFGILFVVLDLAFSLLWIPALVNFATQQKFGAAFHFREIGNIIGKAKWYKIILSFIVIGIITILMIAISGAIAVAIMLIPHVIGIILGLLVFALLIIFTTFFEARFFHVFLIPEEKPATAKPKQQ